MRKLMTLATLSLICCSAAAQQIYQWTDERGRTQYGQLPPANAAYRQLDIRAPAPIGGELRAPASSPTTADRTDAARTSEEHAREQAQATQAMCKQLEKDLTTLENNPRLRRTNADGEVERIGEDERQQLIAQTRENLQQHCRQG